MMLFCNRPESWIPPSWRAWTWRLPAPPSVGQSPHPTREGSCQYAHVLKGLSQEMDLAFDDMQK
jgi:hypothetical protein